MRVMCQRLAPGMEHHRHADLGAEVLLIDRDGLERLGRGLEQHGVDNGLVLISDRGDRSRQREDGVEILYRQKIGLPRFKPGMCR